MRRHDPRNATERRWSPLRHLALWVGLLCLFGQLSSALHMVLVEHVRCAEHGELVHGELVHVEGDQLADHDSVAHSEGAPSGLAAISSSTGDGDHAHEHCLICSERRRLALVPVTISEWSHSEGSDALVACCPDALRHIPSVYSYAPKTSPPTA